MKKNATVKPHYRQGDVLILNEGAPILKIESVAEIPATAKQQPKSSRIILAHGEVTGHHHQLEVADPADWWKDGEISTSLEKPATLAGELFVALPAGGVVTHQEHARIDLPSGTFRIRRQREYSPEAIRNVAD